MARSRWRTCAKGSACFTKICLPKTTGIQDTTHPSGGLFQRITHQIYLTPNRKLRRFLMNNKPELTLNDLKELLLDNEVTNFDPVAEAFKVYDPDSTGFVDTKVHDRLVEM